MKKTIFFLFNFCLFLTIVSCSESEEFESWEKGGYSPTENISISSSASDNASVTFGQTYQHQVTTTGTYSGAITYTLSNNPDGMTISSTGLIEWTPTKASQITTHSNIKITLTTASSYVLSQTYDLTVSGTCTSGNVLAIWTGDQRSSTDSSKFLGNILHTPIRLITAVPTIVQIVQLKITMNSTRQTVLLRTCISGLQLQLKMGSCSSTINTITPVTLTYFGCLVKAVLLSLLHQIR